jgi:tetratricopeptide (TPR) repeat protein
VLTSRSDPPSRNSVFISYRHMDTWEAAALIRVLLHERFKETDIFWDIESIDPGDDWQKAIEDTYARCKALIAVIGPEWTGTDSSGSGRAIDNPNDWLRREIEAAVARGILILPVLVNEAEMPRPDELPPSLAPLTNHQAVSLRRDDHRSQIDRLIRKLEPVLEPAVDRSDQLYQLGEFDAAKKAIELAIASGHPEVLPQAYNRLGVIKGQEGDAGGAEAAFRSAIACGDREVSPRSAFNLGNLLSHLGDGAAAEDAYRMAIDFSDPAVSPRAYNNLGLLLEKDGRIADAREAFAVALSFRDAHGAPRAALNLGKLLESSSDVGAAVSAYREAIALNHPTVTPLARERLQRLL